MGCLQYYSRFIPNFATRAQPHFRAQRPDAWEWSVECEDILRGLIRCVTDRSVLAPFSPSKPTTLITDAFDVGIGAVSAQEGCPVICILRLLNAAEKGYSQTQKEALAVFWAIRRLHNDVVYFRGKDLRPASGIATRQLGQAMVEITDLNDATVHKRHVDQILFKSSTDQRHQETSEGDSQLHTPSAQPTELHQSYVQKQPIETQGHCHEQAEPTIAGLAVRRARMTRHF
ncbi:unnamed protein product [Echinostoma caproni]|uniref:RT_RNaseH_2 domain-containing protein n=1 Tax=Echinostoma caproni TaxID=27848 RepID=A0A183B7M0_9TREM|nr:unnamed protein product [Echinostoma caproni]